VRENGHDNGALRDVAELRRGCTCGIGLACPSFPDASTIVNLAVGGSWPGNTANPTSYSADLDLYSIEYYGP
jgi:hypothetical protein